MDKEMIMNIALAVIAFIGSIITGVLVPYIKASQNKAYIIILESFVKSLVYAAEETFVGQGRGDEKFKWVYEELVKKYPKLKSEEAKAYIQAAVKQMRNVEEAINKNL